MINTIILGHALNVLPRLPAESISCCVCSPPYWSLRDYGVAPVIWDGNKNCKHEWGKSINKKMTGGKESAGTGTHKSGVGHFNVNSNFCQKCGAWCGSLGLEPTFELYIKHLCDIFDEVKRVLRKDGTCWVNIGDSYAGGKGQSGARDASFQDERFKKGESLEHGYHQASGGHGKTRPADGKIGIPAKSLCDIPYRFSIEMVNRGWIKRNTIIWEKPNCMPASANDRFTVDFEYLFFFSKSNKTLFWTNEKTLECISKKPLGTKGIENEDWKWIPCPACEGNIKDKICPRCKDSGKVKYSFWSGHDYWFEQQFEEYAPDTLPRMDRGININKWTFGANGQTPHNLSQPRLNKKRGYKTKQPEKEIQGPQHHGEDISYGKHGRNKRCVWKIPTKSFKEAHFATFPETLIEPIIKAGCPELICKKCGMTRMKILDNSERINTRPGNDVGNKKSGKDIDPNKELHKSDLSKYRQQIKYKELGYTDCGCNAGWESGIVLDPFMGAGTTALVALTQRKRFIGIEIKQGYIDMSYKRIAKVQQRIF